MGKLLRRLDELFGRATSTVSELGIAKAIVFAGQFGIIFALVSYVYSCGARKQAIEDQRTAKQFQA